MTAVTPAHRKAAAEFEAVLAGQLVRQMFESMPRSDMGGGAAEEIFRSMLAERVGDSIARHGGIGVARSVEVALERAGGAK
ncbi:MAG: rod-binding protein [Alphaproteobacteria bacterium]|nr:rod-binding protein [Alphaproteobacteria bacterium]